MAAAITTAVVARIILFAFMLVLFLKSIQTPPYFQTLFILLLTEHVYNARKRIMETISAYI